MPKFGISLINVDQLNIFQDLEILSEIGGIDYLHIDIMDNNYVPRFGINPELIKSLSNFFDFKLDVHLMIRNINNFLTDYNSILYQSSISIHLNMLNLKELCIIPKFFKIVLDLVDDKKYCDKISFPLDILSGITFMGIKPGVLNQVHKPCIVINKISDFKSLSTNEDFELQIDGGFNFNTAKKLKDSGINSFVGGSNSFCKDIKTGLNKFKKKEIYKRNIDQIFSLIG